MMDQSRISQLSLLADSILVSIEEHQRLHRDGDNHSYIDQTDSLDRLRQGIVELERDLSKAEAERTLPAGLLRKIESDLIRLQKQSHQLHSLLNTGNPPAGPLSHDKKKGDVTDGIILSNGRKSVRFLDRELFHDIPHVYDDDDDHALDAKITRHQQQLLLQDQDESLDSLSSSVRRQRDLSINIGDELDAHTQLLDELDVLADHSQSRLDIAKDRLYRFSRKARKNGRISTICILIVVLLVLLTVFK